MAQQTTIDIPAGVWTQVTNSSVTNVTFQCFGNGIIHLKGTASAVAPTTTVGALRYRSGYGEVDKTLAALFPGVTTPVRLYAYSEENTQIVVGHT